MAAIKEEIPDAIVPGNPIVSQFCSVQSKRSKLGQDRQDR
jgi:hypothetical protein